MPLRALQMHSFQKFKKYAGVICPRAMNNETLKEFHGTGSEVILSRRTDGRRRTNFDFLSSADNLVELKINNTDLAGRYTTGIIHVFI